MPALLSHMCRAPYLLRCHLWPINVLSDPALRDFCWRLPSSQRANRRMLHDYLASKLSTGVLPLNSEKETFAHVLLHSRSPGMPAKSSSN